MDCEPQLTDNDIMLRVSGDDIQQLNVLFRKYHRILNSFFENLGCDVQTAQDLTQETFIRILKFRSSFSQRYTFKNWMFQIARNVRVDHLRKHGRRSMIEIEEEEHSTSHNPFDDLHQSEINDQLHQAMQMLNTDQQTLLYLARFEGLDYREIGKTVGCSANNVKTRIFRTLEKLREHYFQLSERTPV